MRDWLSLHAGKNRRHLIDSHVLQWSALLNDKSCIEESYQKFIAKHAGLFWGDPCKTLMCISKFEFGNEYKADFVIPRDDGSLGFVYEIVEIESPHDQVFTKAGLPSQALLSAQKQIDDWRRWLKNHDIERLELLPSKALLLNGDERFNFSIYIGRRDHMQKNDQRRLDFSKSHNVNLRSFDSLTDKLENYPFFNISLLASVEEEKLTMQERNDLANPFFSSVTFKEWKFFCRKPGFHYAHMYALNLKRVLESRCHSELLQLFDSDGQ